MESLTKNHQKQQVLERITAKAFAPAVMVSCQELDGRVF